MIWDGNGSPLGLARGADCLGSASLEFVVVVGIFVVVVVVVLLSPFKIIFLVVVVVVVVVVVWSSPFKYHFLFFVRSRPRLDSRY